MEFDKRKEAMLASLGLSETDKSPKGSLDTPIIPLINAINSHPSYFTTSSCSGRISILSQPTTTALKPKKKASGGSWLFITHEPADPDSVLNLLFPSEANRSDQQSELVFRFEPFILAVECKDLASAQSLVSMAIASGFRESGITSVSKRVIIAIRCAIRLELPLGSNQKIMVSPEYIRYLVAIANEKMEVNQKRTDGFFQALQNNGFGLINEANECSNGSVCSDGSEELEGKDKAFHSGNLIYFFKIMFV